MTDSKKEKNILIIAGEASGDLHGSNLVKEVKKLNPAVKFKGMGGNLMKEAGVDILFHIREFGVVGLFEVLKKVPALKKVQKELIRIVKQQKPDLVVLIDYPGFNIRLAEKLEKEKVPVLYYILPQVWAWGGGRVNKLARLTDKMASIIPFEPDLFNKVGGDCEYIGHPLMDKLESYKMDKELISKIEQDKKFKILILPGSRMNEIENVFPAMVKTAEQLSNKSSLDIKFYISAAETINPDVIKTALEGYSFDFELFETNLYEYLSIAHFALVTSGTATLETAIFKVPMAIFYKTSGLTYSLAKLLVKVENIGLVNIISGKKIVNEYIQKLKPAEIAEELVSVIESPEKLNEIKKQLSGVREALGKSGASENGARLLLNLLEG